MKNSYNFFIHQSNRAEALAGELVRVLSRYRQEDFSFEPDILLVNNYEMGQWLAIQLAEGIGICANVEFRLLGSFLWQKALGFSAARESDVITKERLTWLIFRLLYDRKLYGDVAAQAGFRGKRQLTDYLERCPAQEIFSLSLALADTFDRYLNYRPDMLKEWEKRQSVEENEWQSLLWQGITGARNGQEFRVEHLSRLAERFSNGNAPIDFPKKLFLFGISHMPPVHLELVHAISQTIPVHLFVLNPCRHYWFDIKPEKFRIAMMNNLDQEGVDTLFPVGNSLLASMGQAGRAFLARLYGFEFMEGEKDIFESNAKAEKATERDAQAPSMLHTLQDDILELNSGTTQLQFINPNDDSIRFHSCHGPLRQVEALHDCLIHLFENNSDITPERVLVMAPDMDTFAPFIRAVLDTVPEGQKRLPYSLADISLDQSNQVIHAFLELFASLQQEITAPDLLDLFSLPVIMERYGIDEHDISIIRNWVRRSGARRGIERLSSKLEVYENTLAFGLDRLYAAYAFGSASDASILTEFGLLPYDTSLEGDDARRLSALSTFIYALHEFSCRLMSRDEKGLSCEEWGNLFDWLITAFLYQSSDREDNEIEELKESLSVIVKSMEEAEIDSMDHREMLAVVRHYLQKIPPPRSFLTGRITFSNMVPMRAIPFDVICLLGMNSGEFPRRPTFPAFDLVARDFRPGDRNPRDEDRYLFMETILSARQKLWLFYNGRRQKDDAPQAPSIVIDELGSYIDDRFILSDREQKKASEFVRIHHPLQPFSRRYMDGSMKERHRVYSSTWSPLNEKGGFLKKRDIPVFCPDPLPLDEEDAEVLLTVSPQDIAWFFASPYKQFLKKRMGIDADIIDEAIEANEPDSLGKLPGRLLLERLVQLAKNGLPDDLNAVIAPLPALIKAQGEMPPLSLGKVRWQDFLDKLNLKKFILKKLNVHGVPETPLNLRTSIRISHDNILQVVGVAGRLNASGTLLEYTEKIYDANRARAWVIDILLSYAMPEEWRKDMVMAVMDRTNLELDGLEQKDAQNMAQVLARLYCRGLETPLPFIPRYSYKFAKKLLDKDNKMSGLKEESELQDLAYDVDESIIQWLMNNARFNSYKDHWQEYAFRTKGTGGIKSMIMSSPFRETALEFFNGFFSCIRKGR